MMRYGRGMRAYGQPGYGMYAYGQPGYGIYGLGQEAGDAGVETGVDWSARFKVGVPTAGVLGVMIGFFAGWLVFKK